MLCAALVSCTSATNEQAALPSSEGDESEGFDEPMGSAEQPEPESEQSGEPSEPADQADPPTTQRDETEATTEQSDGPAAPADESAERADETAEQADGAAEPADNAAEPADDTAAPVDEPAESQPAQTGDSGQASDRTADQPVPANSEFLGSYELVDERFGTMVTVRVSGTTRSIVSNALPNHETGDFPNPGNPNTISAQDRAWELTTEPVYMGTPTLVREIGVALNGVKFEPGTGESVNCATGERYRIEGLQDLFDLGMDMNNAHVQPSGEYHYHGVSEYLVAAFEHESDLVLVGFAADGHLIYYSKSGAFESGYALASATRTGSDCTYRDESVPIAQTVPDGTYASDWVFAEGAGDLDECNGTDVDGAYAYLLTQEYPYVPRCLMGEVPEGAVSGPGPGGRPGGGPNDDPRDGSRRPRPPDAPRPNADGTNRP